MNHGKAKNGFEDLVRSLRDGDVFERAEAAKALGPLRDSRAVEPLIQALQHFDGHLRIAVAYALGEIGDRRAIGPLTKQLPYHESRDEFTAYVNALGMLKDDGAVTKLTDRLKTCDFLGKERVIRVLGMLQDSRAVGPLIGQLRDPQTSVQRAAARALGEIGDPRAVEPLTNCLRDEDYMMRRDSMRALGMLKDQRAVAALVIALNRVAEKDCYGNPEYAENANAAEALGAIGSPRATESLAAAFRSSDARLSRSAATALAKCDESSALDFFLEALRDSKNGTLDVAVDAIAALNNDYVIDRVGKCIHDSDDVFRRQLARVLVNVTFKCKAGRVVDLLAELLRDPSKEVRIVAAGGLSNLNSSHAILPLISALTDVDKDVASKAEDGLEKTPGARDALVSWLQTKYGCRATKPSAKVAHGVFDRAVQFFTLALFHGAPTCANESVATTAPDCGNDLVSSDLVSSEANGRRLACLALGRIGNESAVDVLNAALRDADNRVRSYAALSLGSLMNRRAVSPLIAALSDIDRDVRSRAAEALGKLKDEAATTALVNCTKDVDFDVQRAGVQALGELSSHHASRRLGEMLLQLPEGASLRETVLTALRKMGSREAVEAILRFLANYNWLSRSIYTDIYARIVQTSLIEFLAAEKGTWSQIETLASLKDIQYRAFDPGSSEPNDFGTDCVMTLKFDRVRQQANSMLARRGRAMP